MYLVSELGDLNHLRLYIKYRSERERYIENIGLRRCVGNPHKNRKIRTHVLNDLRTYPSGMKLSQFMVPQYEGMDITVLIQCS